MSCGPGICRIDPTTRDNPWVEIDPSLVDAGYRLAEVVCHDVASDERSHGDLSQGTATFNIEDGETVACTFHLALAAACICPPEI